MPDKQLDGGRGSVWSLDRKGTVLAFRNRCRTSSELSSISGL